MKKNKRDNTVQAEKAMKILQEADVKLSPDNVLELHRLLVTTEDVAPYHASPENEPPMRPLVYRRPPANKIGYAANDSDIQRVVEAFNEQGYVVTQILPIRDKHNITRYQLLGIHQDVLHPPGVLMIKENPNE